MYLSKWWTLTLVTVLLFAAGCGSSGGEAQKTVDRLYRSMQTGDSNAHLDTILPENRLMPNPMSAFGIFGAIFANLGLGDFGLGLNLGSLMESVSQFTIQNLKLTVLQEREEYVLVEARGEIRFSVLSIEVPFCDQHDVRKQDGKWYVDLYAPEREARLQKLAATKGEVLVDGLVWPLTGILSGDMTAVFEKFGDELQTLVNFCE